MTVFATAPRVVSDKTLAKAQAVVDADTIVLADQPNVFYVPSSKAGVFYRVQIDYDGPAAVWASCTCEYGRRRVLPQQTLCYHATAALLHVLRERGEGVSDLLAIQEA